MAEQIIYSEQKFLVLRNSKGRLCFYPKYFNPAQHNGETLDGYLFFVDDEDFLPFIKAGEKPAIYAFRVVNSYNFKLRSNVERGIATRDKHGVFVFKSISQSEMDDIQIYDAEFLPIVYEGSLNCVEIQKVRK